MHSNLSLPNHKLKGSALVMILIMLGIFATLLVSALKSNPQIERDKISTDVMAKAKEALIGYAATYRDTHAGNVFGYLPCPDMGRNPAGSEGLEDSAGCIDAGNKDKNVIGRLPWRTLGLPPLRDSNGDCLWYAVSGNFKSNTPTDLMSWDTNGQFEIFSSDGVGKIAGASATNRAVAIIFSPGRALGSQSRAPDAGINAPECGGNMDAANYLDSATIGGTTFSNYFANDSTSFNAAKHVIDTAANLVKQFISGDAKDASGNTIINDRLLFITPTDIFANKVEKRSDFQPLLVDPATGMLMRTAECIANYGLTVQSATKRLPWAVPLNMDASGAEKYGARSNYTATNAILTGRTPYNADALSLAWFSTVNCPTFLPSDVNWWNNHKDQIFYAVANAYKPGAGVADCAMAANCLTVDGNGRYAAVVIFSGKKLAGQNRNTNTDYTSTDKATLSNYLEGNNIAAMAAAGNGDFAKGSNDTLVCIKCDLTLDVGCNTPGLPTCAGNPWNFEYATQWAGVPPLDAANVAVGGTSNTNGTSGDDNVSITGDLSVWVNLGSGNDELLVTGNFTGGGAFGAGDDKVKIVGNVTNAIDLGAGDDYLDIGGNSQGYIDAGAGDDKILIGGNATASIALGSGNDELHIKGSASNSIDAGNGDNKIRIDGGISANIQVGSGDDYVLVFGDAATMDAGAGNDVILIGGNATAWLDLGAGNDYLEILGNSAGLNAGNGNDIIKIKGSATNTIDLGAGDDILVVGGTITWIGGGGGNDKLYLKNEIAANCSSLLSKIAGDVENVKVSDGMCRGSTFTVP
ncbi:MAG: calcium-binding protein [Sulfuricellaceae bacterium]